MAVNNLVVRLRADIEDYSAKLTEAQRMMATRIANIRAAVREETAIARQALREKERMAELGLKVDVDAARRAFHQRVELARATASAELREARRSAGARAGSAAAPEATSKFAALAKQFSFTNQQAGGATGGIGRLNDALITMTRTATGVPPVVGKMTDVFGSMMIGVGPMVLILAGITALAAAIAKITEKSREAKKAVEDLRAAAKKIADDQKNSPEAQAFLALGQSGRDVEAARRKLAEARKPKQQVAFTPSGQAVITDFIDQSAITKAQNQLTEFEEIWKRNLINVRNIATESFEGVSSDAKKAADEAKRAAAEAAAARLKSFQDLATVVGAGLATPEQFAEMRAVADEAYKAMTDTKAPASAVADAFERWQAATRALRADMEMLPPLVRDLADKGFTKDGLKLGMRGAPTVAGPGGGPPPTPGVGLLDPFREQLKKMLDPGAILNNALGGLATQGMSMLFSGAIKGLSDLGKSLLGFTSATERVTREVIKNLDALLLSLRGTEQEKALGSLKDTILGEIEKLTAGVLSSGGARAARDFDRALQPLRDAKTFEEFQAALKALEPLFRSLPNGMEIWNKLLAASTAIWEDANEQVKSFSDALRNIPSGFKIAQAVFNATSADSYRSPIAGRLGLSPSNDTLTVRVVAEPAGIFRVVEGEAVDKKRRGGKLAWELA